MSPHLFLFDCAAGNFGCLPFSFLGTKAVGIVSKGGVRLDSLLRLYHELNTSGIQFYTWELDDQKAAAIEINGEYAVFMDFDNIASCVEEHVIVAHEGGHCITGATHCLSSPFDLIQKHENRADKWAIKKLVPEDELDAAVAAGYTELWSLAEYFSVTEDFMKKAVCYYTNGNLAAELYF